MNLRLGSNLFMGVTIPILWGTRAIVQDSDGRLSVIDLSGSSAKLEILADEPAPGIEYRPTSDGFSILREGVSIYKFNSAERLLMSDSLQLPEVQIGNYETRVGTNIFSGNSVMGMAIGIAVDENSMIFGVSQMPPGLAKLIV